MSERARAEKITKYGLVSDVSRGIGMCHRLKTGYEQICALAGSVPDVSSSFTRHLGILIT